MFDERGMRFFTTVYKAGRLEYAAVQIVLGAAMYALFRFVLELSLNTPEGSLPSFDHVTYKHGSVGVFAVGFTVVFFLIFINTARRLKDLDRGLAGTLTLLAPMAGIIFSIYLALATNTSEKTYTPYGDNPYDPNSWVPPEEPASSTAAVSYNGTALRLPGEDHSQNSQAA